ncbi:TPA_asm: UL9.5 uORF [Human alphaherpesvirus 1]|nr:TPA_asm: UL9.5 uORF [Human alphaherpesvirus 1]
MGSSSGRCRGCCILAYNTSVWSSATSS